jgi:hypothetical protein
MLGTPSWQPHVKVIRGTSDRSSTHRLNLSSNGTLIGRVVRGSGHEHRRKDRLGATELHRAFVWLRWEGTPEDEKKGEPPQVSKKREPPNTKSLNRVYRR